LHQQRSGWKNQAQMSQDHADHHEVEVTTPLFRCAGVSITNIFFTVDIR
jgi:hypothetical protein